MVHDSPSILGGMESIFWGDFARPSRRGNIQRCHMTSGQIIVATENTTDFPQMVVEEGKWDPGYFRKIQVGEIL